MQHHHPPLHGSGAPAQSAAHRDIAAECRGSVRIELYPLHGSRSLQLLLALRKQTVKLLIWLRDVAVDPRQFNFSLP